MKDIQCLKRLGALKLTSVSMSFDVVKVAKIAASNVRESDIGRSPEHRIAIELAVFSEKLYSSSTTKTVHVLYNSKTRVSAALRVSNTLRLLHRKMANTSDYTTFGEQLATNATRNLAVLFWRSSRVQGLSLWVFKGPAWHWVCANTDNDISRAVRTMLMRTGIHPALPASPVGMSGGIQWLTLAQLCRLPMCCVCGKEGARSVCGNCKRQHYCSQSCMRADRARHVKECGGDTMLLFPNGSQLPAEFKKFVAKHGDGGDIFCSALGG
jgi:hypothetical protein